VLEEAIRENTRQEFMACSSVRRCTVQGADSVGYEAGVFSDVFMFLVEFSGIAERHYESINNSQRPELDAS